MAGQVLKKEKHRNYKEGIVEFALDVFPAASYFIEVKSETLKKEYQFVKE
jgi:hypothetical protein